MVGIGGAVWLVFSVRRVRCDELEERLVVEDEGKIELERRLFAFWSSLSLSLVVKEVGEMIERRLARLRSLLPSSDSLSSSPEQEEPEGFGIGGTGMTMSAVLTETVDGGDEEEEERVASES